jgi:hypothetical protein
VVGDLLQFDVLAREQRDVTVGNAEAGLPPWRCARWRYPGVLNTQGVFMAILPGRRPDGTAEAIPPIFRANG